MRFLSPWYLLFCTLPCTALDARQYLRLLCSLVLKVNEHKREIAFRGLSIDTKASIFRVSACICRGSPVTDMALEIPYNNLRRSINRD